MKWLKSLIDGYLGRLLLVLLSTFLVFFFLEMIFRWISKVESAEDFLANSLTHTIDTLTYRNSGCLWREALYPHPYLDFVQNMKSHCFSLHVNEKGFYSPEFPKANDPNTFDILITGGSVANHLAVGMTQGGLIQRLEGLRAKDGRSIRAYSSAVASWKQPTAQSR